MTLTHRCLTATLYLAALLASGCASASDSPVSGVVRRDSAGVIIVENPADAPDAKMWIVDSVPHVSIGEATGAPEYMLGNITHVARTTNGLIAAFDAATMQVRFFGADGRHVATHGRAGDGPGEFKGAIQLSAEGGDTVLVVDPALTRWVRISASAGHVETRRFVNAELRAMVKDTALTNDTPQWLSDSLIAWRTLRTSLVVRGPDGEPGFSHDLLYLIDLARDNAFLLADYERERGRVVHISAGTRELTPIQAIQRRFLADARHDMICAARPRFAEVACMSKNGQERRVRWVDAKLPFPEAEREKALAASLARAEERGKTPSEKATNRADVEKMYAAREWPPHWFPLERYDIDAGASIWVLEHAAHPSDPSYRRFRIFSAAGEHIAFATYFPHTIFEIGSEDVVAVYRDADDVQRIGVFRIHK